MKVTQQFHHQGYNAARGEGGEQPFELTLTSPAWQSEGSCAQTGPDDRLWFPEGKGKHMTRIVRKVCGACPVNDLCLEWALANDVEGMWAGTTTNERRTIRKQRGAE